MPRKIALVKAKPIKTTILADPKVWHGARIVAALKDIDRSELVNLALVHYFQTAILPEEEQEILRIANGHPVPEVLKKKWRDA